MRRRQKNFEEKKQEKGSVFTITVLGLLHITDLNPYTDERDKP